MGEAKFQRLLILGVIAAVALVHLPGLFLGFNLFWDRVYVFHNPFFSPLSLELFGKAFTTVVEADYTPIPQLSYSLDFTFWGWTPFGYRLSNCLLFLAGTGLVFFLLRMLAGLAGVSSRRASVLAGLTALLFGIHPLKVSVVAWVTGREHLLYPVFYLLAILAYLKWNGKRTLGAYVLSVACALGAGLSKANSVSLPLALLVLDHYPLARLRKGRWQAALLDKIPFFLVSGLTVAKGMQVRQQISYIHPAGLENHLGNLLEFPAVLLFYAWKTIFPLFLSPIYPLNLTGNAYLIISAWLGVGAALVFFLRKGRKHPALVSGTCFFLVLLLPQGGLVRSGATVLADRYAQLANLPILLALSWLLVRAWRIPRFRFAAVLLGGTWMVFLSIKTMTYTGYWDKAVALTQVAYERYPESEEIKYFMVGSYNNSAMDLAARGDIEQALAQLNASLAVKPEVGTYGNLAYLMTRLGRLEMAERYYRDALALNPSPGDSRKIQQCLREIQVRREKQGASPAE